MHASGRFPANLIHDGSDEVVGLFPTSKSSPRKVSNRRTNGTHEYGFGTDVYSPHNDSGSSARFFYTAKASKSERNAGLEGFEKKLGKIGNHGNISAGDDLSKKLGSNTPMANHHPTIKPLSLTKYLANLIKPPTGGRLLVPFSGSGSEMIGALQAGWEYVEGVELTEEYIPIAEARIKYWTSIKELEQSKLL
jgi:site-specific DNA-methyltransferase (adenine-specific)